MVELINSIVYAVS